MTDHVETYTKMRYRLVTLLAVAYLISQLASLSFASGFTGLPQTTLTLIENIGVGILALTVLVGMWAFMSARKQGEGVLTALNDELTKAHFQSAAVFAFKFIFFLSFVLFVLSQRHPMGGEDMSRIVFTACLVVSYLRFAWLEARHA